MGYLGQKSNLCMTMTRMSKVGAMTPLAQSWNLYDDCPCKVCKQQFNRNFQIAEVVYIYGETLILILMSLQSRCSATECNWLILKRAHFEARSSLPTIISQNCLKVGWLKYLITLFPSFPLPLAPPLPLAVVPTLPHSFQPAVVPPRSLAPLSQPGLSQHSRPLVDTLT